MISIFLRRLHANRNASLASCLPFQSQAAAAPDPLVHHLEALDRLIRKGTWSLHRVFANASPEVSLGQFLYHPAPASDFNSARLLYFARYHEMADRAEWEWCNSRDPLSATSEREVFYFANLDPGDRVQARLVSWRDEAPSGFAHHIRLFRESDRRFMAEVFTSKSRPCAQAS